MDHYNYLEPDYQLVANNSTLYITCFAIIVLFSVILNVTLLMIFIRNPVIISPSHLYYINLACTNISFALFAMTFGVVTSMSGRWIFPEIVCQLVGFFHSLFLCVIMFTSFALISERYSFRASQTRYNATYTSKRVGITIGVYWLLSLLLSSTPFIPGLNTYTLHNNKATCFVPEGILHYMLTIILFVYIILWSYVSYSTVFITKISVPKQLMNNRRSDKFLPSLLTSGAFTLIALTYVTFEILCLYVRYLDVQDDKGVLGEVVSVEFTENFEKISFLLLYVSTLVQPLLILTLNGDIRSACANILNPGQGPSPLLEKLPPPPTHHQQIKQGHQTLDRYQKPRWTSDKRYMTLSMITEKRDAPQPLTTKTKSLSHMAHPGHMTLPTKHQSMSGHNQQNNSHVIPLQPMALKSASGQQSGTLKSVQQQPSTATSSKSSSATEIVEL